MTEERYNRMAEGIRRRKYGVFLINVVSRSIVWITMGAYLFLVFYLYNKKDYQNLYQCILVPGAAFFVVSIFRQLFNKKRPYEVWNIQPLIQKDKFGKSFPSRHVFSIFIIGMTFWQISSTIAMLLFAMGVLLAILRVLGGVHFVSDVVAGAAIGILSGFLGFFVIF